VPEWCDWTAVTTDESAFSKGLCKGYWKKPLSGAQVVSFRWVDGIVDLMGK